MFIIYFQSLKKNWTNLTYTERKSEFGQPFSFDYSTFDMNSQWIVRGQPDNRIVIRNRWTLQIDNASLNWFIFF